MIFKKTIDFGLKKVLAIHHNEDGQLLAVWLTAIMAMGSVFMGTAYDMSNAWVHKQWADTAAEASCTAGAMDMEYAANSGGTPSAPDPAYNFLTATSGDCADGESNAMCYYANLNGYSSKAVGATVTSNDVSWSTSTVPPSNAASSSAIVNGATANGVPAYLSVTVTENVPVTFMGIFAKAFSMSNSWQTVQVVGHCNCGLGSGGGSQGSQGSQEQTFTGQCPIANAVYSSEWQIASISPYQLRTTGTNFPTDWINFQCSAWTDSQGNPQPQNYLSTIPGAIIDGVDASINAASQSSLDYYPVFGSIAFIANNGGAPAATSYCCIFPTVASTITGEVAGYTDVFITGVSPTIPYYTVGSSTTMDGISSANMMNALANNQYFGMAVYIQGNGPRIFVGGGIDQQPNITVYYHTGGGYYVATFGND